jgi:hypothetical protein
MTYVNMADLMFALGKIREGIEAGEIALEIDPQGYKSDALRHNLNMMKKKLEEEPNKP